MSTMDNVMDNVRAFQREFEELGVSSKSVETRIAEAINDEREACAKVADKHAELGYNNAREIAAAIRARR